MTTQKKTTIGGQAIIEGIVMKGPKTVSYTHLTLPTTSIV